MISPSRRSFDRENMSDTRVFKSVVTIETDDGPKESTLIQIDDDHPLTTAEANASFPVIYQTTVTVAKNEQTGELTIPRSYLMLQKCEICGTPSRNRCSRCQRIAYCCQGHQKLDWQRHKGRECDQMAVRHQHYLDVRQQAVTAAPETLAKYKDSKEPIQLHVFFIFPEGELTALDYDVRNRAVTFA